jgi:hypothetical protein
VRHIIVFEEDDALLVTEYRESLPL